MLEEIRAWELLHDPNVGGQMDADTFYEWCKLAGYNEDASKRAMKQRALERMRKDLPA